MAYTKGEPDLSISGIESWRDDTGQPRILFVTDSYDDELREFWCDHWPRLYDWLMTDETICPEIGTKFGDIALIVRLG